MTDADELPKGWVLTTLGTVASIEMGQSPEGNATNVTGEGIALIGGAADLDPAGVVRAGRFTTSPTKLCAPGDIVLCIRATIGRPTVADRQYCLGRGVAGLRPTAVEQVYLVHFLRHCEQQLDELGTGSTFRTVDKATLRGYPERKALAFTQQSTEA